jgi:hypothetical protein
MTGMTPPTSSDDKQGTVIDGTARSAEWREKQRAAQTPHGPASHATSTGVPAADFDPEAVKDFVSSLMIPASKLAGEARQEPPAPEPPDSYIDTLLNGPAERQPTQELEEDARASATQSDRARPLVRVAGHLGPARAGSSEAPSRQRKPRPWDRPRIGGRAASTLSRAPSASRARTRERPATSGANGSPAPAEQGASNSRAGPGRDHADRPINRRDRDRCGRLPGTPLPDQVGTGINLDDLP